MPAFTSPKLRRAAAAVDVPGARGPGADAARVAVVDHGFDIDAVAVCNATRGEVIGIEEHHATVALVAAVAVVAATRGGSENIFV